MYVYIHVCDVTQLLAWLGIHVCAVCKQAGCWLRERAFVPLSVCHRLCDYLLAPIVTHIILVMYMHAHTKKHTISRSAERSQRFRAVMKSLMFKLKIQRWVCAWFSWYFFVCRRALTQKCTHWSTCTFPQLRLGRTLKRNWWVWALMFELCAYVRHESEEQVDFCICDRAK